MDRALNEIRTVILKLDEMDRKTWKIMTIIKEVYTKSDIDGYTYRLIGCKNCVLQKKIVLVGM